MSIHKKIPLRCNLNLFWFVFVCLGHFKGYKIETWTDKEGELHAREMVSNASKAFVNKFVPHSVNFVRVRVINSAHQGPASEVLSFTTPEGSK